MEEGERGGERTRVVKRGGVRGLWRVWQTERGKGGKDRGEGTLKEKQEEDERVEQGESDAGGEGGGRFKKKAQVGDVVLGDRAELTRETPLTLRKYSFVVGVARGHHAGRLRGHSPNSTKAVCHCSVRANGYPHTLQNLPKDYINTCAHSKTLYIFLKGTQPAQSPRTSEAHPSDPPRRRFRTKTPSPRPCACSTPAAAGAGTRIASSPSPSPAPTARRWGHPGPRPVISRASERAVRRRQAGARPRRARAASARPRPRWSAHRRRAARRGRRYDVPGGTGRRAGNGHAAAASRRRRRR